MIEDISFLLSLGILIAIFFSKLLGFSGMILIPLLTLPIKYYKTENDMSIYNILYWLSLISYFSL